MSHSLTKAVVSSYFHFYSFRNLGKSGQKCDQSGTPFFLQLLDCHCCPKDRLDKKSTGPPATVQQDSFKYWKEKTKFLEATVLKQISFIFQQQQYFASLFPPNVD